ncbi:MAG: DUF378 domain-containing protein [Kofleriaceae bacterium]|nr:DUF378 domain-containing protein [Kofleriaceae bacterium]
MGDAMQESKRSTLTAIADVVWLVAAVGAINWGLVGLFDFNVIDRLFTDRPTRFLYVVVGLCGLAALLLIPLLRVKTTVGRRPAHSRA